MRSLVDSQWKDSGKNKVSLWIIMDNYFVFTLTSSRQSLIPLLSSFFTQFLNACYTVFTRVIIGAFHLLSERLYTYSTGLTITTTTLNNKELLRR